MFAKIDSLFEEKQFFYKKNCKVFFSYLIIYKYCQCMVYNEIKYGTHFDYSTLICNKNYPVMIKLFCFCFDFE